MKLGPVLIIFLLFFSEQAQAQSPGLNVSSWVNELSRSNDKKNESFIKLDSILNAADSIKTFQFINELKDKGKQEGYYFKARSNCIKARQLYLKNLPPTTSKVKEEVKLLFAEALNNAYESEDEALIAFVSINYGGLIYHFGEMELSVMYLMNGVEMNEKLFGSNPPSVYHSLGNLLYQIKEYKGSVEYSTKAVEGWEKLPRDIPEAAIMSSLNTIGLGYHRQGIYDSAFIYYKKALQVADKIKNEVWKGIVSGNMGQVYYLQKKYDTALSLLQMDYRVSKEAGYFDNAGNSLQWAARTQLATGDKSAALSSIREAIQLMKKWPVANYIRNTYYAATEIFSEIGIYDSAFYYNKLYSKLNDSLELVANLSSIAISKAKLNDEKSRYSINNLQREKRSQVFQRNILIGLIVVLSVFAYLIVNRQRLKSRLKMEIMQKEMIAAKDQMNMFTQNIIEKTSLIEKLEEQVKSKVASEEQETIIKELTHQTILTEEEWIRFRALFEKINPGFFNQLKQKANDISVAEQRMAALIRLQLTTRQAASMLGISLESVHKTRQRLRQRLQVDAETTLETFISVT